MDIRDYLPADAALTPAELSLAWRMLEATMQEWSVQRGVWQDAHSGSWEYRGAPRSVWRIRWQHIEVRSESGEDKNNTFARFIRKWCSSHCLPHIHSARLARVEKADLAVGHSRPARLGERRCDNCLREQSDDIYHCGEAVLCGDCRYELRHGAPAPNYRERDDLFWKNEKMLDGRAGPTSAAKEHLAEATETISRWRPTEITSMRQYEILMDLERTDAELHKECWHD